MAEPDREKDARLLAALRHAPDHDVAPPARLKGRIFEDARRAVRPGMRSHWWAWPTWLRQPASAAALASVMMATVIGLMWRDGPPPETQVAAELPAPSAAPAAAESSLPTLPAVPTPLEPRARVAVRPAPAVAPAIANVPAPPTLMPPPSLPPPATATLEMRRELPAPALATGRMGAAPSAAPQRAEKSANSVADVAVTVDPLADAIAKLAAGSETLALLLDVQAQARGRWTPVVAAQSPMGTPVLDAQGRLLGHFSLQDRVARWQSAAAPAQAWRATLSTATKTPE